MLSDERLAEIAAADRAATPGPWFVQVPPWEPSVWAEKYGPVWRWDEDNEFLARPEDMAFIALARTAVPELLAEVQRLRALLAATTIALGSSIQQVERLLARD